MSREQKRPLGEHVQPPIDDARLARQWSNISKRLERRPRGRLLFFTVGPALVIAAAVIALAVARPWQSSSPTVSVAAPAGTQSEMVLADGSRINVAPSSHVSFVHASRERVHLFLDAGSVECDVTHVEGRPFVVTAAGHDVTVLGTMFTVSIAPRGPQSQLSVSVRRGRVRVSGPTGEHVLDAGQSWSATIDPQSVPSAPTASASPAVAPIASASPAVAPTASVATTAAPEEPALPPDPTPRPSPSATSTSVVEGPRELLSRATDARAQGRPRDAAAAFDALRKKHRTDARAGLAAFELGRLRLDALGDPAGAVEALSDAIALSPTAPFREDAEARRVEALDALPDRARCENARDAYLSRYPAGLHAKRIAQRCRRP